jgi:hypothetical protein
MRQIIVGFNRPIQPIKINFFKLLKTIAWSSNAKLHMIMQTDCFLKYKQKEKKIF